MARPAVPPAGVTLKGKTKRNKKVTRDWARVGSTSAALKVALKKKSTFRVCVAAVNASGTSAAACRSGEGQVVSAHPDLGRGALEQPSPV